MPLDDTLRSLLVAHGPSGYETAPAEAFRAAAKAFSEDISTDIMGSVLARVPGTEPEGLTVAVVGHLDEIGLIVTHIDEKGYLYFVGVGGWDGQQLVGQRVAITTRDGVVPGVIGRKPVHLLKEEERKKAAELNDLHIDVGARNAEDAAALVRIGDVAVIDADPVELPNDRVASRALDNRLGSYIALESARLVAEAGGAAGDVVAVGVVQEEVGLNGARALAYSLQPDVAIVVDVTHETDAPGIDAKRLGAHTFGSGAVIERGTILHPRVYELLVEAAEAESIPHTFMASASRTGTDADAIHLTRGGIVTGGIGLPLRYMHSAVEVVQLDDVANCAKLIAAFCRRLAADTDLSRG